MSGTAQPGATAGTPPSLSFADPFGAFCRHNHVALAHSGEGPLSGRRFAVKDVFAIAGSRTGFGNPDWLRTHVPATTTAAAVRMLLAAGADLAGRTQTDELTYSLSGENVHYGTPINPAAPARIPGGSSSGSVVAVAGGLVDFALGTDCGGSIRLPASYCGVLGMRPTHGAVPVDGVIPFAPTFDVVGWFARDPGVFAGVGGVLLGRAAASCSFRRLLIARDAFDTLEPATARALEDAVRRVTERIGDAREVQVSPGGLQAWFETFRVIQGAEIWANHGTWITGVQPVFGTAIRERLAWASAVSAAALTAARAEHTRIRAHLAGLLGAGDLLCLPTSPRVAPLKHAPPDQLEDAYRHQAMWLLCIAGLGGLPQVSLPLAARDGVPLGLSLVGPRGSDAALLALTARLMADAAR